jgi:ribosomal protein L5
MSEPGTDPRLRVEAELPSHRRLDKHQKELEALTGRVTKQHIAIEQVAQWTTKEVHALKIQLDRTENHYAMMKLLCFILATYSLVLALLLFWKL